MTDILQVWFLMYSLAYSLAEVKIILSVQTLKYSATIKNITLHIFNTLLPISLQLVRLTIIYSEEN